MEREGKEKRRMEVSADRMLLTVVSCDEGRNIRNYAIKDYKNEVTMER